MPATRSESSRCPAQTPTKQRLASATIESDADKDLEARETEEAKRLLYVAVTRARDRLYLGATLNEEGRFAPPKGSLGRVLPSSLCELVTRAGTTEAGDVLSWTAAGGTHHLRVLRAAGLVDEYSAPTEQSAGRLDDFDPLPATGAPRRVAASDDLHAAHEPAFRPAAAPAFGAQAGILVHRALEAGWAAEVVARDERHARFASLLRANERAVVADVDDLVGRAVMAFDAIVSSPELLDIVRSDVLSCPRTAVLAAHRRRHDRARCDRPAWCSTATAVLRCSSSRPVTRIPATSGNWRCMSPPPARCFQVPMSRGRVIYGAGQLSLEHGV